MGITFLAAGTSVPEAVSSVIVAKQGKYLDWYFLLVLNKVLVCRAGSIQVELVKAILRSMSLLTTLCFLFASKGKLHCCCFVVIPFFFLWKSEERQIGVSRSHRAK